MMMQSFLAFPCFLPQTPYVHSKTIVQITPNTMSQTMKALVVQPDYSVKIQDKPKPSASELGPKEVIFKVLAVGQSTLHLPWPIVAIFSHSASLTLSPFLLFFPCCCLFNLSSFCRPNVSAVISSTFHSTMRLD